MARTRLNSTSIRSVCYDDQRRTLEIELEHGGVYRYFDMPAQIYRGLKAAESAGAYFQANIRGHFRYIKLS
jgi:hypothetical protein